MLDVIISSKTRVKLLIKFFLIKGSKGYLRGLEKEFNETSNAVRVELNRLTKAGLLKSGFEGKRKIYQANPDHPLYNDITHLVHTTVGIDHLAERVVGKIGSLEEAYVTGSFASGVDSDTIELVLMGSELDTGYIDRLIKVAEMIICRKIMYLSLTQDQMEHFFKDRPHLLIWKAGQKNDPDNTVKT
jgi:DNA-binding transcriptional ArsR family regulator